MGLIQDAAESANRDLGLLRYDRGVYNIVGFPDKFDVAAFLTLRRIRRPQDGA
jgi:hypothetical protein